MWIALSLAAMVIIVFCAWWFVAHSAPRLNRSQQRSIRTHWTAATAVADPHRRVMDGDAVVAKLLRELGFQGSMADGLKKGGKYLPGINDVWTAHKLRNRLAHEPGIQPSAREVDAAMRTFGKVIEKFCGR